MWTHVIKDGKQVARIIQRGPTVTQMELRDPIPPRPDAEPWAQPIRYRFIPNNRFKELVDEI